MAVGAGAYWAAVATAILALIALGPLKRLLGAARSEAEDTTGD
jgi:hypothetical protein